ncbi:MAG: ABC transporter substrate-binding protein [Candidatus Eremiobacteraeota bacterium]|nr:ABC transporter substrate-binding protein [Candidatus Eremiobacteraeota bacterium]
MKPGFRILPAALALGLLTSTLGGPPSPARAADSGPIKIAVVTDMSGVYAALAGQGAVEATKLAVEDFGGKVLGRSVEVVAIDHRNNGPDAAIKVREAYDGGADLALDLTNSAVALAVAAVAKEKHKLAIVTGGGSSDLTGANCDRYTYHYAYDTYALANSTGSNIAAQASGKNWYALVPNYRFGQSMLTDFTAAIERKGGKVQKADLYPFGTTTDFSSYLLAAKNSGAQVLGLFNAGTDTVNSMKQAKQFGLDKTMKIAVGLLFLSDVDALPDVFAGSRITTSWYWNQDKAARAWADKYAKRMHGLRPTDIQASDYSAASQWLSAVKAVGTTDADKVQGYLDGRQFNDFYARGGEWRARDHRVIHEMYVVDVLPKDQVKEPHAWFKVVQTIPPGRAFRPESQSTCKKDW